MSIKKFTDQEIWEGLFRGDRAMTEVVFETYGQRSFKFAMSYCKWTVSSRERRITEAEAWALVRDAVIIAYDMAFKLKRSLKCQLLTLLCAIIKNKWRDENRRKPARPFSEDRQQNFMRRLVRHVLEKTEELCRGKLIMRYYYGFEFAEIAEMMGYKAATVVTTLISRCRDKFRKMVKVAIATLDELDLETGKEYLEDVLDDLDERKGLA